MFRYLAGISLTALCTLPALAQTVPPESPSEKQAVPHYPPVAPPPNLDRLGVNIQRTMTLLATSTPKHRHRVKILFYGQSITQQSWSQEVADDLRRRFPNADLTIENRAIGGFASQLLKSPIEHDLYPFYPDLVIFHVYGDHHDYEQIIHDIRARTTAEVLMQTDHVTQDTALTEETDPTKLAPNTWDAWMNHVFLPQTAHKYGAELADVHEGWKSYLSAHQLHAAQLLRDGVHLNDWGNYVMAREVEPYLRYDPKMSDAPWKNLVHDYRVGHDVKWENGHLKLPFNGNRIEAIAMPSKKGGQAVAQVLIDGKKPSEIPELTVFTRPGVTPNVGWPAIIRVSSEKPLLLEEWTARITQINEDATQFKFEVSGSKTGFDGTGSSDARFVSNSGRVVIEPQSWFLHSDYELSKKGTPVGWEIKWKAVPLYADQLSAINIADPGREYATNLAQGLSNGPHTLELIAEGAKTVPLKALRVYTPPVR